MVDDNTDVDPLASVEPVGKPLPVWNIFSITAFISGVLGVIGLFAPVEVIWLTIVFAVLGIILGYLGRKQIKASHQHGKRFALAGLVLGGAALVTLAGLAVVVILISNGTIV